MTRNNNYLNVVPLSFDERYEMYMKCSKEELARMMAEKDKIVDPAACKECCAFVHTDFDSVTSSNAISNQPADDGMYYFSDFNVTGETI